MNQPKLDVVLTPIGAYIYITNCMPVVVPREQDSEEEYRKRVEIAIKE